MFELQPFLDRCDAFLAASGWSQSRLSKELFSEGTRKLSWLRAGKCSATLSSLQEAVRRLDALESDPETDVAPKGGASAPERGVSQ